MAVDRDQFFAELDRLTEQEIEARVPMWDRERLDLVEEYIDLRWDQATRNTREEAALVAAQVARRAATRATAALILALGAWLTAGVSGLIAYLAFMK